MNLPIPLCWQSDLIDSKKSSQIPDSHPSYLCSRTTEPPMTRPVLLSISTKEVHLGSRILACVWPSPILGSSSWMMLDKSTSLESRSQLLIKLSEFQQFKVCTYLFFFESLTIFTTETGSFSSSALGKTWCSGEGWVQ